LIIFLGFVIKRILVHYVEKSLAKFFETTKATWDDLIFEAVAKPLNAFITIGSIHLAVFLLVFRLDSFPEDLIGKSYTVALGLVIIWGVYRMVDVLAHYLDEVAAGKDETIRGQFLPLIKQALRVFVIIIGSLTVLATVGVNIAGVLGGLAVGGLAISMAAKDTFANFIGTFNMLTDRPFKVGDWISVGDNIDGDVEAIGFRSTRIRTFGKTELTVPNGLLATEVINNWSRMPKRRVKMTIGITYDTKPDQMRKLLKRIEKILDEDEGVDQGYKLVQFTGFGASSLDIFLYYFTKSTVWKEYLDVRERINLKIMETVEDMGLDFAFPTQTIHVKGDGLETLQRSA
jgi:MscS family membrane protein